MAQQTRNQLKQWFETGDYPTQNQFWDWLDSFFHYTDEIAVNNVNGLQDILNALGSRPNNKEKIIINNVATVSIVWNPARVAAFGIFPKVQVWVLGQDGVYAMMPVEPAIDNPFTTMTFDFGTPTTGFIIIS
jgi:hypothetical protein